ncbi:MAG TPA: hypothetical protein VJB14_08755 [Planctomycetota bacterium]|nr:hypothetical protein [Planctomycetota bacterium]
MEPFPLADRLYVDILEARYGPVHAEIRRHDERLRESFLADAKRIPRTYALSFLANPMPREARTVDADIRRGELLGRAFLRHGLEVRKNVIDVTVLELPPWLRQAFRTERHAMARSAEFYAKREGAPPIIYAVVTEVYSPDIKRPLLAEIDIAQMSAATPELERAGFTREEIWDRIGRQNFWSDVRERHDAARVASLPSLFAHRKKIARHLAGPHKRADFRWKK